jgi:hypothetical protein
LQQSVLIIFVNLLGTGDNLDVLLAEYLLLGKEFPFLVCLAHGESHVGLVDR